MNETVNTRVWEELEPLVRGDIPDEVGQYIEQQTYDHQDRLAGVFAQLQARSTPAFRQNIGAVAGAAMPTSFQEYDHVRTALDQYVGQRTSHGPLRMVGYLNWPHYLPHRAGRETRAAIEIFMAEHPEVPYAYFEGFEPAPIAIGGIRKVVTDALMAISHPDALLNGQDADQRRLSPGFFDTLLTRYRQKAQTEPVAAVMPRLTHERLPAHLANMDRVIQWFEDGERVDLTGSYFEPGPAIGARDYRIANGYGEQDVLAETHNLIDRIQDSEETPSKGVLYVPAAHMVMSPRRLVEKLETYHRLSEMWTGGADFGAEHAYRESDETYADIHDLPDSVRDMRLREFGATLLTNTIAVATSTMGEHAGRAYALQHLEQIRQRIGGPENMFS